MLVLYTFYRYYGCLISCFWLLLEPWFSCRPHRGMAGRFGMGRWPSTDLRLGNVVVFHPRGSLVLWFKSVFLGWKPLPLQSSLGFCEPALGVGSHEQGTAFGSVLCSGKRLNVVCGALNADKASFWQMPLLPLQHFGLFCSEPGLFSLLVWLGWAGLVYGR